MPVDAAAGPGAKPALPAWWRWARVVLPAAAGVLLALQVAQLVSVYLWNLRFPYDLEYGEGNLLLQAAALARGQGLYGDYRHYPFVVCTYPFGYPLLCVPLVKVFGMHFALGRALSMLATLGTGAWIWALLRRAGCSRVASGLATALFLGAPYTRAWGGLMRVDMTAICLGLTGLGLVARGGRWVWWAIVPFTLAVYTRQSEVAPVGAAVLWLAWQGRRREALGLGLGFLATAGVILVALQWSSGGWFWRHVGVSNRNEWSLALLLPLWSAWLRNWTFPFALAVVGLGLTLRRQGRAGKPLVVVFLLYFLIAVAVSFSGGKIGAFINYMLEPLAAACLLTGVAWDRVMAAGSRLGRAAVLAVGAGLLAMLVVTLPYAWPWPTYAIGHRLAWREGPAVVRAMRTARGEVLSEYAGWPLLAGKRVLLEPFEFTQMWRDGSWDQRPLVADLKRGRFSLVAVTWDPAHAALDEWGTYGGGRWTPAMAAAIRERYRVVEQVGRVWLLAPATPWPPGESAP